MQQINHYSEMDEMLIDAAAAALLA